MPIESPGDGPEPPVGVPSIPSFASLRDPRRRSAFDLLVPERAPEPPAPEPPPEPAPPPASAPPLASTSRPEPAAAPRPPEYADLLLLGAHLVRAVPGATVRVVAWSVRQPVGCLRRLLGGATGVRPGRR